MHLSDFPSVGDLFLGRYRVEAVLGAGGFARVYRAVQEDLERLVAIKVMRPAVDTEESTEETLAQIQQVEERFRREAKVISKFRSPNTVVVHDYGRTNGGLLYMTLEYVDGQTVKDLITNTAPIAPRRVVHIVKQVLRSLHEAHSFDILHRDIKPQNIMVYDHLDQTDLVKVLDFGIAKLMEVEEEAAAVEELTTDGVLVGTPRYMSPEQIRGDRLGPASDLYSLGLVTFEMLTGSKAVDETTTMRIIARHLDPSPLRFPDSAPVGDALRSIVERMIAKEPDARFESARELLKQLDDWDPEEPVPVIADEEPLDDVADTVKFEAAPPPQPLSTPDMSSSAAQTQPDDENFYAADTQMLAAEELPDPSWDQPEPAPAPPAQFIHPTTEPGEDATGQLSSPSRSVPWVPIGIAAVLVLVVATGVAIATGAGGDDAGAGDEATAKPDEPPVAVAKSMDGVEVEPIDGPDDEQPEAADEPDADTTRPGFEPGTATQLEPDEETANEATDDDDADPRPPASSDEPADDSDSKPADHETVIKRKKPRKTPPRKQKKRRFFSVE
jgi:serine/threonine protein kinase